MAALIQNGEAIYALNDRLRQQGLGGTIVMTRGVLALGAETVTQIQRAVAQFDDSRPITIRMANTTSALSKCTAIGCSSKSIIMTLTCATIRLIHQTLP